MSNFSGMDCWYDVIKSYDDPNGKDPSKKDDGTYSQFSVVMVLIYLTFGNNHPSNIAQFFRELKNPDIVNHRRASVLMYKNRIAGLLKKMEEDELLIMNEEKEKGRKGPLRKKYRLNPKIIQSIFRDGTHVMHDDPIFEIPIEKVAKTLAILEKFNEDDKVRNELLSRVVLTEVDYFAFLMFLFVSIGYRNFLDNLDPLAELDFTSHHIIKCIKELDQLTGISFNWSGKYVLYHNFTYLYICYTIFEYAKKIRLLPKNFVYDFQKI